MFGGLGVTSGPLLSCQLVILTPLAIVNKLLSFGLHLLVEEGETHPLPPSPLLLRLNRIRSGFHFLDYVTGQGYVAQFLTVLLSLS